MSARGWQQTLNGGREGGDRDRGFNGFEVVCTPYMCAAYPLEGSIYVSIPLVGAQWQLSKTLLL